MNCTPIDEHEHLHHSTKRGTRAAQKESAKRSVLSRESNNKVINCTFVVTATVLRLKLANIGTIYQEYTTDKRRKKGKSTPVILQQGRGEHC